MKGFVKSNFDLKIAVIQGFRAPPLSGFRDSGIIAALRDHEIP